MSTRKLLPLLIAASIPAVYAADQQNTLEETITTATAFEQKLTSALATAHVITSEEIARIQAPDLPSVLERVPGVNLFGSGGRGSVAGLTVRGKKSSQVLVLIDGVRSASATIGATSLQSIPVESVDRVEVVLGPMSGIYGADAAGGVIQVFTKRGTDGFDADVYASYASYQTRNVGVNLRGGNDVVSYSLGVSDERTGGFDRIVDPAGNLDRDEFDETSGNASLRIKLGDRATFFSSLLIQDSTVDFDSAFDPKSADYFSENKLTTAAVGVELLPAEEWFASLTYGYTEDESNTFAITEEFVYGYPSFITTERDSLTLLVSKQIGNNLQLSGGIDIYEEDIETNNDFPETSRDNEGAFVQLQYDNDVLAFGINLRHDDNSAYGENTTGGVSIGYQIVDAVELVVSYGEAFRAPTFNDLYFPFYGNPNIQPEEMDTYEISLRGNVADVQWRISAYDTDATNLISYDFTTFLAGNVAAAELKGVEVELGGQLAGWDWQLGLDYLDAYDKEDNSYLDDRARFTGIAQLGRRFGKLDVLVDWQQEHGRYDRGGKLGGYGLLGLALSYEVSPGLVLKVSGKNLLDKDYVENLAGANIPYRVEGRTGSVGFSWSF